MTTVLQKAGKLATVQFSLPSILKRGETTVINSIYDLKGRTIELPPYSTLLFQGNGLLKNGTIIGHNSSIMAEKKIFDNITVKGTWSCVGNVKWWATGCEVQENNGVWQITNWIDESLQLQQALDSPFRELHFPPMPFYIASTIVLGMEKKLVLHGSSMNGTLDDAQPNISNTCIIFTNNDTPLLRIAVKEGARFNTSSIAIEGGNFDTSKCTNYTSNCIEVLADNNEKLWGLRIATNINGRKGSKTGVGININPTENKSMTGNKAFVTQIRINSNISNFKTGVKATNYMDTTTCQYYNWCTSLIIEGAICYCLTAIDSNVEGLDIRAMIQPGFFFDKKQNNTPLIHYSGTLAAMSSDIYDLRLKDDKGNYTNYYALEISTPNAAFKAYGPFRAILSINDGVGIITGHTENFIL